MKPPARLLEAMELIAAGSKSLVAAKQALDAGRQHDAEPLLDKCLRDSRAACDLCLKHNLLGTHTALGQIATALFLQRKYEQARDIAEQRLQLSRQTSISEQQESLEMLAHISMKLASIDEACRYYQAAIALHESRRAMLAAESHQITFADDGSHLYARLIEAQFQQGSSAAALHTIERAKSRALSDLLGTSDLPCPSARVEVVERERELLRETRTVAEDWRKSGPTDSAIRTGLWARWIQLRRDLDCLWDQMAGDEGSAEYLALRRGASPDVDALRRCLASPNETARAGLLSYFVAKDTTFAVLLTPGGSEPLYADTGVSGTELRNCALRLLIDFHGILSLPKETSAAAISDALALEPKVSALRRQLPVTEMNLRKLSYSYDFTYWERLGSALVPDCFREAMAACDLLCISPHSWLHALPVSALRLVSGEYLIERFGVAVTPSAGVLRFCQAKNRARTRGARHRLTSCLVAAVGASSTPEMNIGDDTEEFEADAEIISELFGGVDQHRWVTRLRGPCGEESASREHIVHSMPGHDVIHLACHGVFAGASGDPLDSGLAVSDGDSCPPVAALHHLRAGTRSPHVLTARDIFGVPLKADLVTLRACSSGRAVIRSGDELLGLTRAFLYAGAPSLIVSLWDVNKRSSQRLLAEFYWNWFRNSNAMPKWRALQSAQIAMLRDSQYNHPYHWAPFTLIGDWV